MNMKINSSHDKFSHDTMNIHLDYLPLNDLDDVKNKHQQQTVAQ